jgi:hypothetical protein
VQRRVEQDGTLDLTIGRGRAAARRSELATEAVPTIQCRTSDPERVGGVDEVGDVLLDAPGRLPRRVAVAAVVDADDAGRDESLLPELPEAAAVPRDAVQADDRRALRVAPLPHAQLHDSTSFPK